MVLVEYGNHILKELSTQGFWNLSCVELNLHMFLEALVILALGNLLQGPCLGIALRVKVNAILQYSPCEPSRMVDGDAVSCIIANSPIGLIGSSYFIGVAISCAILPPLADKYGRKKIFATSLTIQTIAMIMIMLSKNVYLTCFCYLISFAT